MNQLRQDDAFLPQLSLVAEQDGALVGHILFTAAQVGNAPVLALAPLSVLPGYQKKGIGTALIREGHRIGRQLGYGYSVVLGCETYYPRLGYRPAAQFGIEAPFPVPSENFMACKLREDAPAVYGVMKYPKSFLID